MIDEELQENSIDKDIDSILNPHFAELKTAMPGRIEKYNPDNQTVTVQPLFNRTFLDENENEKQVNYPLIHNVPVQFPRFGNFVITFPVKPKNGTFLNFAERSLDTFMESDGKTIIDPKNARKHNINDAIATSEISTLKNKINNVSIDNLVIRSLDGSVEIHLTPNNEVLIKADKVNLGRLNASNPSAKGNETQESLDSIKMWIETVKTALQGLGISTPLINIKNVKSTKVFIDD